MDRPVATSIGGDGMPLKEYEPGPSLPIPEPNSVPAPTFTLTLHGNCAKCHHHHRSYTVAVQASDDPKEPTPINCERCKQRWLTIGGRNVTQLSLLSTKTVDLDSEDVDFRFTLVNMVRSATAIASPTALASVPEAPSHLPSRGTSQRSIVQRTEGKLQPAGGPDDDQAPQVPIQTPTAEGIQAPAIPSHQGPDYHRLRSPKAILRRLKSVLKDGFSALKKVRDMPDPIKAPGKVMATTKGESKRPTPDAMREQGEVAKMNADGLNATPNTQQKDEPAKSTDETVDYCKDAADMEMLVKMTRAELYAWLRNQITEHKSQHIHPLSRRYSSSMVDSSTQVHSLTSRRGSVPRRHSFLEIGSHFRPQSPDFRLSYVSSLGYHYQYPRSIDISATRTSEAETAVDSQSFISSARHSLHDATHRPFSSRPTSFHSPLYLSRHVRSESTPRNSTDSMATRSLGRIGERGRERRSIGSARHIRLLASQAGVGDGDTTEFARSSQDQDLARGVQAEEDDITPTATSPPQDGLPSITSGMRR